MELKFSLLKEVLLLFFFAAFPTNEQDFCPNSNWTIQEFHCYLESVTQETFDNASAHCQANGGHLATIDSALVNEFLIYNVTTDLNGYHWVGLSGAFQENWTHESLTWNDGQSLNYSNWAIGEPKTSSHLIDDCVAVDASAGKWKIFACTEKLHYICSISNSNYKTEESECVNGSNNCSANADCFITNENYTCSCQNGFHGDGINCTEIVAVHCQSSFIVLELYPVFFMDKKIPLADLHLLDFSCSGFVSNSSSNWIFNISTFSSCSNIFQEDEKHFTYTNTLSNIHPSGLYIQNFFSSTFKCNYEKNIDGVSLSEGGYAVKHRSYEIDFPNITQTFLVSMNRYLNESYTILDERASYDVTDMLFIQIALESADPELKLVINRCWVTPDIIDNKRREYTFIENKCAIPGIGNVEISKSGVGHKAAFQSQAFVFVNTSVVYLHCSLYVCLSSYANSCVPVCSNRRKRAIKKSSARNKRQSPSVRDEETVSIGPFFLKEDEDEEKNLNQQPSSVSDNILLNCAVVELYCAYRLLYILTLLIAIVIAGAVVVLGFLFCIIFDFQRRQSFQRKKN